MVSIAIVSMVRFATLGGSMFEDLARELPVRLRRWLELHLCFAARYFATTGISASSTWLCLPPIGFRSFGVARAARRIRLDEHKFRN